MNAPARWLFAIARRLMPPGQRGWGDAMRAEADYLPAREAIRWAIGCVYTAFQTRLHMNTGTFRLSRWAMLVETLGCFGPMTLAWYEICFGMPGLLRHDWTTLSTVYGGMNGGAFMVWMIVFGAVVGLVGSIGLTLGLRYVVTGKGLGSAVAGCTLIGALLLYALAGVAGLFVGPADWQIDATMMVLFVALPIAGLVHLMWLARPVPPHDVAGLAAL